MNFKELETPEKLRGKYYTAADVAGFLTRWVLELRPERVLEPSCGDGAFLEQLVAAPGIKSVAGCELDPEEAEKARARAKKLKGVSVKIDQEDFLQWALTRLAERQEFDAVLGNPPFIRYQYLDPEIQARAEQLFSNAGLAFTKHTNAWVPFVVASLALLRPGGRLAMVVPSELLHVLHAGSLRQYLVKQCSQVLVIDPEDIWFGSTLQGVVLLLAEKCKTTNDRGAKVAILPVKDRGALTKAPGEHFRMADFISASALNGKWMLGLLSRSERSLLAHIGTVPGISRFSDVASVDVGIVTGANKFFLVDDATVAEYGLESFAHPMFGRSDHVAGVIYDPTAHEANRKRGLPTNFLWFKDTPLTQLPEGVRRYIRRGEAEGLPRRYKCRIRTPWYSVPSVSTTPVGMLKRSHNFPRLILNTAGAFTTDTVYRITLPAETKAADLVFSFVNSLTALTCELEGRHYGGGVLELVPSEIERVLVPLARSDAAALKRLDKLVRSGTPAEGVLAQQDTILKSLGLSAKDTLALLSAWERLRVRRQRAVAVKKG